MGIDKKTIFADAMVKEYNAARERFPQFHSSHEGYAVLLEEVDEYWDGVKNNRGDDYAIDELIQIAAMAMALYVEIHADY